MGGEGSAYDFTGELDYVSLQRGSMVPDRAFFLAGGIETEDKSGWGGVLVNVYVEGVNSERNARTHTEDVINGLKEGCWARAIGVIVARTVLERSDGG